MLMWTIAEMYITTFTITRPVSILISIWPEHRSRAAVYYGFLVTAHPRQHKNVSTSLPSHIDYILKKGASYLIGIAS